MSTTLIPPSYYEVKAKGKPARQYRTAGAAAAAIVQLARTTATVGVVTGTRRRNLTQPELRELARQVRALRMHAARGNIRAGFSD